MSLGEVALFAEGNSCGGTRLSAISHYNSQPLEEQVPNCRENRGITPQDPLHISHSLVTKCFTYFCILIFKPDPTSLT